MAWATSFETSSAGTSGNTLEKSRLRRLARPQGRGVRPHACAETRGIAAMQGRAARRAPAEGASDRSWCGSTCSARSFADPARPACGGHDVRGAGVTVRQPKVAIAVAFPRAPGAAAPWLLWSGRPRPMLPRAGAFPLVHPLLRSLHAPARPLCSSRRAARLLRLRYGSDYTLPAPPAGLVAQRRPANENEENRRREALGPSMHARWGGQLGHLDAVTDRSWWLAAAVRVAARPASFASAPRAALRWCIAFHKEG